LSRLSCEKRDFPVFFRYGILWKFPRFCPASFPFAAFSIFWGYFQAAPAGPGSRQKRRINAKETNISFEENHFAFDAMKPLKRLQRL